MTPEYATPSPTEVLPVVLAAHERLERTVEGLDDEAVRRPSLLPDWSIGHVLTHLARNADSHVRRLEGALRGEEVRRYPGGPEQRDRDILDGAGRSAAELAADVEATNRRLATTWRTCVEADWPHSDLYAGDSWSITWSPLRRLREVEMHHADLGLDYAVADWPGEYVAWDLPHLLADVPHRVDSDGARHLLAWLSGRADSAAGITLDSM